jgi:hypothetical protein
MLAIRGFLPIFRLSLHSDGCFLGFVWKRRNRLAVRNGEVKTMNKTAKGSLAS